MLSLKRTHKYRRWVYLTIVAFTVSITSLAVREEMRTSEIQARHFSRLAKAMTYEILPGPSSAIRFPRSGSYDKRLGFSELPRFLERLKKAGFEVESQTRFSPELFRMTEQGLFPPYREKDQAGLRVLSRDRRVLFSKVYPERVYASFEAIPRVIVDTLLAIENRELLDGRYPKRNPAIEWDRLLRAALQYPFWGGHGKGQRGPGGSTLATQLEKVRHSPAGITPSVGEKLRQLVSASLRAYRDGEQTLEAQKFIVVNYLNSLPLAAVPGHGEVIGLADGLKSWFGAEFDETNRILGAGYPMPDENNPAARALAYKQVLCLLLAQRRPTWLLIQGRDKLLPLTDAYLRVLSRDGVINPALRDAALAVPLTFLPSASRHHNHATPRERKTANIIRTRLAGLLGLSDLYALDRLDITVETTLDQAAQEAVTAMLLGLRDPDQVKAVGLSSYRLLDRGNPDAVKYSFSLYERGTGVNWLRVQTDNLHRPFDLNEGMKLDLGSTAKLRTLATYLQIVADSYQRYIGLAPEDLRSITVHASDRLTAWVIEQLASKPHTPLSTVLDAAMDRRYSASPAEGFYTGGGLHYFRNFGSANNGRMLSVQEAFRDSVNLVFIRLMRDIVRYYQRRFPDSTAEMLEDPDHWLRETYLRRFADEEGSVFLRRFYRKYAGLSPEASLRTLLRRGRLTHKRLATILRSVKPRDSRAQFVADMRTHLLDATLKGHELEKLYDAYSVDRYDLQDRGYIAGVHPLALWLVGYLFAHPEATLQQILAASATERLQAYRWLFNTKSKKAQDRRIRNLLEIDAFKQVHSAWKQLGYPFESLVPSYATAIGASADRPAALAELIGILLNDGVRYPTHRIQRLRFAEGTPYETVVTAVPSEGKRVLAPEVAAVVRGALVETVEKGTAKRAHAAIADRDDRPLTIGGKTGTGDHRHKVYGRGRQLIEERVVNRTAAFVFLIGDRFYGVVTAHVAGPEAAGYRFTSALVVQLFRVLAPELLAVIGRAEATFIAAQGTQPIDTNHLEYLLRGDTNPPITSRARGH